MGRHQDHVALLFIDIDQLRRINESLGHETGDRVIQEAARRLRECVRAEDTVAHFGGDEFLVILTELSDPAAAETVAAKVLNLLAKPFELDGRRLTLTASIGVTLAPDDDSEASVLLRNGEAAVQLAKAGGGDSCRFFTRELSDRALQRLELEGLLRGALERGELDLHYQPLVSIESGEVVGAEALLRWKNPLLGQVPPSQFVPVAEDNGLIVPIGEWALRKAAREAASWPADRRLKVAVNLSCRQFVEGDLVETVKGVLAETGLDPARLELEVTERLLVQDVEQASVVLTRLRELGVSLSIDDFGTGYSALSYLRRFPFDTLKIDRSFLSNVASSDQDAALTRSIVALAHCLQLNVIGEGVETEAQLAFLRDCSAELGQGYLFSPPLPAREFADRWLRQACSQAVG